MEGGRADGQQVDTGGEEKGGVDSGVYGIAEGGGDLRGEVTGPVINKVLQAAHGHHLQALLSWHLWRRRLPEMHICRGLQGTQ